jgi:two-component system LytT family sensor kinase
MRRRRWYYIIFFAVFFIFWFLFKIGGWADFRKAFLSTFVDVFVTSITMLIIVELLLPKQLYRNRYTIFFTCFILLILFSGTVIIFSQLNLLGSSLANYQKNIEKHNTHYFYWFWADLIFGSYFLVAFISSAGAAIRVAFDRIKTVNHVEKLEKEKVHAELQSLKNQINPHFLFNALNTIYYKIDRSNISARDTLQRFSEMLRYQLYDCDKEMIGIDKELLFLQSYIELQKERLNGNYEVVYRGFDSVKEFQISPFLLLPLVENCFKYVSSYADQLNKN